VEDDEYNYKFLENTLSRLNARLLWACDGEQAIDFVQQYPEIQVVLMDIGLPKMNGFVATRKIVKLKNSLPVIAQTAYALSEDEESCYSAGCVDYISKPVDPVVLVMKINNAILEAKD
jgi:CheY-like chemotaxis protein